MQKNLINSDNIYPLGLDLQPIKLFKDIKMVNWKTTLSGLIAFIPVIINAIHATIPQPWSGLLTGIGGVFAFYFAKDK